MVIHDGEFKDGKEEGYGTEIWSNGDEYQGWFSNGSNNGFGVWKIEGEVKYMGQWKNDHMEGYGVHFNINKDGSIW